jgi:SAM-dependent methyltransferase
MKQERKPLGSLFNEAPREYNEVRPDYPEELVEDVIRISRIPKGGRILEVGCGTGQATIPFAVRGYSMLCLDIGEDLVRIARENLKNYPRVEVRCVSFEDWEPERNAFDLLTAATAFHWVKPEVGYPKAAMVLKETGYIALFWNLHPTPYTGFFEDVQSVYQSVVPEWRDPRSRPETEVEIRQREEYINGTGFFERIQVLRYPWTRTYTADQYIKLLNTYSDHRSLEEGRRIELYAEIRKLIEEEYGGRVVRPYLSVLYIAKKRA